jgi:hypothetical protein
MAVTLGLPILRARRRERRPIGHDSAHTASSLKPRHRVGVALHERADRRAVLRAHDDVAFPVSGL